MHRERSVQKSCYGEVNRHYPLLRAILFEVYVGVYHSLKHYLCHVSSESSTTIGRVTGLIPMDVLKWQWISHP